MLPPLALQPIYLSCIGSVKDSQAISNLQLQQKVMTTAILASMLVNVGTVLSVSAMTFAASASFAAAGFSGVGVLANWIKVCLLYNTLQTVLAMSSIRDHCSLRHNRSK